MRQIDNGIPVLVHLVKDVVPEQRDDVPVARLRPPHVAREPIKAAIR